MKLSAHRQTAVSLERTALVLSSSDNVAVAKQDIPKGARLAFRGSVLSTGNTIEKGHRFALESIGKGKEVRQYSYPFGLSKGISAGSRIESSNVTELKTDLSKLLRNFKKANILNDNSHLQSKSFLGYKRKNGSAGTRNYYLIVPTSLCAADVAGRIAEELNKHSFKGIDGFAAAAHTEGCGSSDGVIIDRMLLTLKNSILNPNISGALIVDLGCEKISADAFLRYAKFASDRAKPVDCLSIQKAGGTRKAVEAGKRIILKRAAQCAAKRVTVPLSKLIVGTECGASDTFSGITANPLIGLAVDKIISTGGSAVLSEMPEMIGAEASLLGRMTSVKTAWDFIAGMRWYAGLAKKLDVALSGNFVPGNKKGGLVNPALKSLGAITKGGMSPIVDYLDYGQRLRKKGLSLMNGPGNDLESMTGIAAGGANIFLFSTGGGATEGNLIAPVIKISSTTELYNNLRDDMDFNAGTLLEGRSSMEVMSNKLLDMVISTASGRKTKAELLNKTSFQIWTAGKLSL